MVLQVAGVSGRGPELSAGRAGRGARVGEGAGMGGAPARSLGQAGGRARRVATAGRRQLAQPGSQQLGAVRSSWGPGAAGSRPSGLRSGCRDACVGFGTLDDDVSER